MERFELVDLNAVVDNWQLLMMARSSLTPFANHNFEKFLNSFMLGIFRKRYDSFAQSFSLFNHIREWVLEYMVLEFWAMFLLYYYANLNQPSVSNISGISGVSGVSGVDASTLPNAQAMLGESLKAKFLTIMTRLVGNAFYIGLVLSKAAKANVLPPLSPRLEDFQKEARKLEFPTNVPLIKTLKAGNKFIIEELQALFKSTPRNLRKSFDYSLNISPIGYESTMVDLRAKLRRELPTEWMKVFQPIDQGLTYEYPEGYPLPKKFKPNLHKNLHVRMSPADFLQLCLDKKENNTSSNRKVHRQLMKLIKEEEERKQRPKQQSKAARTTKLQKSAQRKVAKFRKTSGLSNLDRSNASITRSRSGNLRQPGHSGRGIITSRNKRSPGNQKSTRAGGKSTSKPNRKKKTTKKKTKNLFKESNTSNTGISNLLSHISSKQYRLPNRIQESASQSYLSRNNSHISGQYLSRNNSMNLSPSASKRYMSPIRTYNRPAGRVKGSNTTGRKRTNSKNLFKMSRTDSQLSWTNGGQNNEKKSNKKATRKGKKGKKNQKIGGKLKKNVFVRNTDSIENSQNTLASATKFKISR